MVGTFHEVVSYLKEREAIRLTVTEKKNKLHVVPELPLDKELFTEPLTMVVEGGTMKKVSARQGKRNSPYSSVPIRLFSISTLLAVKL